jgi:hypothetical protein
MRTLIETFLKPTEKTGGMSSDGLLQENAARPPTSEERPTH